MEPVRPVVILLLPVVDTGRAVGVGQFESEVEDLLRKLLDREPSRRIGAGVEDAEEIKRHPWFSGVDWEGVYARKQKVPREKEVNREDDGLEVAMQSELF